MSLRRRKKYVSGARKTKKKNVIVVMGKVCKDGGKGDRIAGRRLGKGPSLEGITLPFASIFYPVPCIHYEEYVSPAFKKLTQTGG